MTRLAATLLAGVILAAVVRSAAVAAPRDRRPPPVDLKTLVRSVEGPLHRLGLRVQRDALVRHKTGQPDGRGDQLSIYVQPTGAYSPDDYLRNAGPVAHVFLPMIFDRWRGLQFMDLCQEPLPSIDNRPEPEAVTQLQISRRGAARIRWPRVTLTKLLAQQARQPSPLAPGPRNFFFYVQAALMTQPRYQQAAAAAHTG